MTTSKYAIEWNRDSMIPDRQMVAQIMLLGDALVDSSEWQEAENCYQQAVFLVEQLEDHDDTRCDVYVSLGIVNDHLGNTTIAEEWLHKAESLIESGRVKAKYHRDVYFELERLNRSRGDLVTAEKYSVLVKEVFAAITASLRLHAPEDKKTPLVALTRPESSGDQNVQGDDISSDCSSHHSKSPRTTKRLPTHSYAVNPIEKASPITDVTVDPIRHLDILRRHAEQRASRGTKQSSIRVHVEGRPPLVGVDEREFQERHFLFVGSTKELRVHADRIIKLRLAPVLGRFATSQTTEITRILSQFFGERSGTGLIWAIPCPLSLSTVSKLSQGEFQLKLTPPTEMKPLPDRGVVELKTPWGTEIAISPSKLGFAEPLGIRGQLEHRTTVREVHDSSGVRCDVRTTAVGRSDGTASGELFPAETQALVKHGAKEFHHEYALLVWVIEDADDTKTWLAGGPRVFELHLTFNTATGCVFALRAAESRWVSLIHAARRLPDLIDQLAFDSTLIGRNVSSKQRVRTSIYFPQSLAMLGLGANAADF